MGDSQLDRWKPAFEELVLQLEPVAGGDDDLAPWYAALSRFSRHSYARLLVSPRQDELHLRLEIALGPPEDDTSLDVERALQDSLRASSETEWAISADDTPAILESALSHEGEASLHALRRLLTKILKLADRFEEISTRREWLELLEHQTASDPDSDPSDATGPDRRDSPFETIGGGSDEQTTGETATIHSFQVDRRDQKLFVAIGFPQVLTPEQLEALHSGLGHHLHTKFDVQTRPLESDEFEDLELSPAVRTALCLELQPGEFSEAISRLEREVQGFVDNLYKFSSYGVDLFEYLGVGDTVLSSGRVKASESQPALSDERTLSFRQRAPSSGEDGPEGVVLDLEADAPSSTSLKPGNYTDPRLQRDDAQTALVDLVLRHPGYSDRRIGQVLSILLSVEYHDAVEIAESAPCVIAWGLGQQRARSFKQVIESAGGKALLVEPGTFGEA